MSKNLTAIVVAFAMSIALEAPVAGAGSVNISVSPTSATLSVNQTQQFTAKVTPMSNSAVTWSVNGIQGGNSTVGTVSSSGLYTAPAAAPAPSAVTVTVTSVADPTKSASAAVTITGGVSVTLSPSSASVSVAQTQQFTATVTGSTNTAVNWAVNGIAGGNSTIGTVSATGYYFAPTAVPSPATVTVTATSAADPTKSASASVTIVNGVAVTLSPSSASVIASQTQQFTATVTGSTNIMAVSWTVNGVAGGNSTLGTISTSGLYTAPAAVPSPATVTVTAISAADSTKSASATVTVVSGVSVTVSPTSASVNVGQTQQFTSTVAGTTNTGVNWSVNGTDGGNSTVGTISTSGLYTAPAAVPSPSSVTVAATSAADSTKSAQASVTIQAGLVISPSSATVDTTQSQQFSVMSNGKGPSKTYNWSVNGIAGGNSAVGKISNKGLYTAPNMPPNPPNATVSASDPTNPSMTGNASVAIVAMVAVAVSPTSVSVQVSQTQQFTVTVTGTTNTAVTWSATAGTISPSGLYTAPSTVPSGAVTVTATSTADTTKSAAASVTVTPPVSVSVSPTSASLQVSQSQQFTATVSGSTNTAVTWSATAGTISTGGLFTAPSTAPSGTVTVKATSSADTTKSASATVTVTQPVSVSVSPTSVSVQVSQTQQFASTVSGTTNTAVTWSASVGTISTSGFYTAPSTVPSSTVTVTAASVADSTKSASAAVKVTPPPPSITTSTLPNGEAGVAYSVTLAANGGTPSYTWSISSGALPAGVSLDGTSGTLSGTPTTSGTYNVTVTLVDALGQLTSKAFSLALASALSITTGSLPSGSVGAAYNVTMTSAGGVAPVAWALSSGQLPAGLSLTQSGNLSGTPTAAGSYGFSVQAIDAQGGTTTQSCSVSILGNLSSPLTITTADLPNGTIGTSYSATMTATGGIAPYTWSVSSGALPAGLSLDGATGLISGIPTAVGWSDFMTVQVADSTGTSVSFNYTVLTKPALDQYGGASGKTCNSTTGWFHTEKVNNRWWLCDPFGNKFWVRAMGGVLEGNYYAGVLTSKYGSSNTDANWAIEQKRRLELWGFNTVGQVSSTSLWPTATNSNAQLPLIGWVWSADALNNQNGYLPAGSSYPKDLTYGVNGNYTMWRWKTVDYFDPNVWTWLDAKMSYDPAQSAMIQSPSTIGVLGDDVDWMGGFGPGVDNETTPVGQTDIHIGWWTMITSPMQAFNPSYQLYPNPTVFSKAAVANPSPTNCSVTNPCSLRDYLKLKYTTIGALNTAWNTNNFYTSFDSTGIATTDIIGTGDGTTTVFSAALSHAPVSPLSMKVLQGVAEEGGDCPWFAAACGLPPTSTNMGALKGLAGTNLLTGAIPQSNYSDGGSLGVALVVAPGYPAKADYHFVVVYHGILSGKSAEIDVGWGDGISRQPVQLSPIQVTGATGYDVYVSCRVWSGVIPSNGCAASTTTPFPPPTLQVVNVPIGTDWGVPTTNLVNGTPLPLDPSFVNYTTGVVQVTLSAPPAKGVAVQVSYTYKGWMSGGTGLMDEDGSHSTWVGTNSRCLTPAYMCQGNYMPYPNAASNFGEDLDAWIVQMSGQYHKQYRATLKKHNPNMMFLGVDAMGTYNAPARKQIIQGAAPYIDIAFPQYFPTASLWNYHMTYFGDKPSIVFNTIAATPDSALFRSAGSYPAIYTGPGYTGAFDFPAQEDRGRAYIYQIDSLFNYLSPYGSYPVVGESFWGLTDFPTEGGGVNWGLVSSNDNPYDGKSSCQAIRNDPWGYPTGGEQIVPSWQTNMNYNPPNGNGNSRIQVNVGGTIYVFEPTISGTSGTTPPIWPTIQGSTVTDGSLVWRNIGVKSAATCFGDAVDYIKQANALWWLGVN